MAQVNTNPTILDGKAVSNKVIKEISKEVAAFKLQGKRAPGLAVVLVGENPASMTYVQNKEKACKALGIYSEVHNIPAEVKEDKLIELITSLNKKDSIDGILVQLPLPIHIKSQNILENIEPSKDVDGLHPVNLGKLLSGQKCLTPCTPQGVIEILKHYSLNISGMQAVVLGRSNLVGKPLSMLLLQENATITLAHSKTNNIQNITQTADILIAAIGKPHLVDKNWIKPGAIVIDVGINRVYQGEKSRLVGDVNFDDVSPLCQAITPVPGGVGPMTIAMLMKNTLEAYKMRAER